jgi:hypothetical protein
LTVNNGLSGGSAISIAGSGTSGSIHIFIDESSILHNGSQGVSVGSTTGPTTVVVRRSAMVNNFGSGVRSDNVQSTVVLTESTVTGNGLGLDPANGGALLSYSDNSIYGNTINGAPTGPLTKN